MPLFGKNTIRSYSDEQLIAHYKSGSDPAYVGVLFERYTELVFLLCMKYFKNETESEDATMYIFERLLKDLKRYEIENFKAWLGTVVRNYCLASLKRKQQRFEKQEELRQVLGSDERVDLRTVDKEQEEYQYQLLEKALDQLKVPQKICVRLFYFENMSYQDITVKTGYTFKEVKSYIQNGKRNLKNILSKYHHE